MSLCEQRERIQQQVELLERRLCVSNSELQQVSSDDTDDESSVDTDQEAEQSTAGLLAERQKIEKEIQNLENVLGPHSSTIASDDDDSSGSSSESELGLSINVDSCLQMNFVYQQILQEKLKQLETLLSHNQRQQKEVLSQLSGPFREASKEEPASSSYPKQAPLFLGHFLKPYFKDKVTGLGPPANSDTKERMMKMKGCLDSSKMKVKRWESWQKTLLIDSVSRDSLKRLIQPKLSRVDYLSQKLSSSGKSEDEKRQLKVHIESLEKDIESIKVKKDEELFGDQYEDHDWHKIAKIDFEGVREADDLRLFWQNFLHPAVNKNRWSADEVQRLKEVSSRHKETNWDLIARELGTGRTAFMCLQTFQRFISSSLKRGTWTSAEDQKLSQLVDNMRIGNFIPYTQISYFMEGRDTPQLIYRWTSVLDPQLKKGSWSKEEDQLLLKAVARHGEKMWWKIRLEVPGRTDGACRDRYLDCLKEGLKKGPFDDHEHQLLVQLLDKHGAGRWAKIAAEIPNRNDAQCLREWKKMMRQAKKPAKIKRRPKISQDSKTIQAVKTKMSSGIRKRLQKVREEEEEEEDSSQEDKDEDQITYMDTDDEKQEDEEEESVKGNSEEEDEEKEEEEEYYLVPPMHEWIPHEESQEFSFPTDRLVTLDPAPNCHLSGTGSVRSTVVAKFGRSVVVGPPPRELSWEERHVNGAMLMVSQKELHSHLCHQANKYNNLQHRPKKGHVTDTEMNYMLQAAVLPWVGNVLMPSLTVPTLADALGHKTALSSTPVFRLLLHAMMVDFSGCKEVILRRSREKRTSPLRRLRCPPRRDTPLPPPRSPPKKPVRMSRQVSTQKRKCKPPGFKNPKTVAAMLHSTRARNSDTQPVRALQQVHLLPQSAPLVCLLTMPPSLTMPPRAPPPVKLQSQTSQRLPTLLPRTPGPICLLTAPSLPVCFVSPPLPVGPTHLPPLAPPPPRSSVTPALGPSTSTVTIDHAYTLPIPKPSLTGRKRARDDDPGSETLSTGGKRVRKLSHKALQLQASATERKRRSWRKSKPKEGGAKLVTPPPSIHTLSLFAHPNGSVQLPQSPNFVLSAAIRPLPSASGPSPVPLERAGLNIDPSLVSPGSPAVVSDWLSGSGGVAIPHLGISLPYLPPCSSSLGALAAIFANRTRLASTAAQLLDCYAQTQAMPPDATSDQTESSLRALVKDHLGSNPAYLLLKARFLSVFALPALLATMRPGATVTSSPTSPCDDKKVMTKGKTQQSNIHGKIACDVSGAPANHFSGISAIGPTLPHPRDTVSNQ
ncbi:snRNA-activating protein complex subunit 4 [Hippocampus comes]|uniref:snRNA-activating protein complex subunit 4 n=1 Tax=Hippocampus comes TaxID=109280 RepID=UPI00094EBD07|nr:PREDICTED: snRNA-activating protein complex subunit 4 [Hippocampus comes]